MDIIAKFDKENRPIVYNDENPVAVKVIRSNEKFTKFRADVGAVGYPGNEMKRYVAVIYEIKEGEN